MPHSRSRVDYPSSLLFALVITDKCTLRCDHCFEESGPENNTFLEMSKVEDLADQCVDVFQEYQNPREIRITGGDPFLHPHIERIIRSFADRKDLLKFDTLDVESNGWWATNDETTEQYVEMLKRSGVNVLTMSLDYFHCKQGKFNIYEHFDRINRLAQKQDLQFRSITSGMCLSEAHEIQIEREKHRNCCKGIVVDVAPIGRGRQLPEAFWDGLHSLHTCLYDCCSPTTAEIVIRADGNVYQCNGGKEFQYASLSSGNVYKRSLKEILENKNPVVQVIREEGLKGLSELAGISHQKYQDMYERLGACGLCHDILRDYGELVAERLKTSKSVYEDRVSV